jgi:hypothetical protein
MCMIRHVHRMYKCVRSVLDSENHASEINLERSIRRLREGLEASGLTQQDGA